MSILNRVLTSVEIRTVDNVFDLPSDANTCYPDLSTALSVVRDEGGRLWRVRGKKGFWYESPRPEIAFLEKTKL